MILRSNCTSSEKYLNERLSLYKIHLVTFGLPKRFRRKQNGTGNSFCMYLEALMQRHGFFLMCLLLICLPAYKNAQ